jgi:hypothetical protein
MVVADPKTGTCDFIDSFPGAGENGGVVEGVRREVIDMIARTKGYTTLPKAPNLEVPRSFSNMQEQFEKRIDSLMAQYMGAVSFGMFVGAAITVSSYLFSFLPSFVRSFLSD